MTILNACSQPLFTAGKSIRVNTNCRNGTYSARDTVLSLRCLDREAHSGRRVSGVSASDSAKLSRDAGLCFDLCGKPALKNGRDESAERQFAECVCGMNWTNKQVQVLQRPTCTPSRTRH